VAEAVGQHRVNRRCNTAAIYPAHDLKPRLTGQKDFYGWLAVFSMIACCGAYLRGSGAGFLMILTLIDAFCP